MIEKKSVKFVRFILILVFFLAAIVLAFWGERLLGNINGLAIMCVAILCLVVSIGIYNRRYK